VKKQNQTSKTDIRRETKDKQYSKVKWKNSKKEQTKSSKRTPLHLISLAAFEAPISQTHTHSAPPLYA